MISRDEALVFMHQQIANENIRKHMYATEAVMRILAKRFDPEKEEEWALAGLLHDADYTSEVSAEEQGIIVSQLLEEKGYEIPESVKHCMASHNYESQFKPESKMDWSLFCSDTLTGLIVATALVRPDKNLASMKVKSVMKKFKDNAFARGTRREHIAMCEEKLGIPLRDFVELSLQAMQAISDELGL